MPPSFFPRPTPLWAKETADIPSLAEEAAHYRREHGPVTAHWIRGDAAVLLFLRDFPKNVDQLEAKDASHAIKQSIWHQHPRDADPACMVALGAPFRGVQRLEWDVVRQWAGIDDENGRGNDNGGTGKPVDRMAVLMGNVALPKAAFMLRRPLVLGIVYSDGACFITQPLEEGDRVVWIFVEEETSPSHGHLCWKRCWGVKPKGVAGMEEMPLILPGKYNQAASTELFKQAFPDGARHHQLAPLVESVYTSHCMQYPKDKLVEMDVYIKAVMGSHETTTAAELESRPDFPAILALKLREYGKRIGQDLVFAQVYEDDGEKFVYGKVGKDTRVIWTWLKRGKDAGSCGIYGSLTPVPPDAKMPRDLGIPCTPASLPSVPPVVLLRGITKPIVGRAFIQVMKCVGRGRSKGDDEVQSIISDNKPEYGVNGIKNKIKLSVDHMEEYGMTVAGVPVPF